MSSGLFPTKKEEPGDPTIEKLYFDNTAMYKRLGTTNRKRGFTLEEPTAHSLPPVPLLKQGLPFQRRNFFHREEDL
jgi:hypothetical protein